MVDPALLPREIIGVLQKTSSWLSLDDDQGDVIQCPPTALCEGSFYVMGFNPGARKRKDQEPSKPLRKTIEELGYIKLDGRHPLEDWPRGWSNLTHLAEQLPRVENWRQHLFVTNLFPDSSGGVSDWLRIRKRRGNHLQCVQQIWPMHQLFLSIVRPQFVIVHGQGSRDSAFRYLWEYLKPDLAMNWDKTMADKTQQDDPSIKTFSMPTLDLGSGDSLADVTFIGIKHLSRSQSHIDVMVDKLIRPKIPLA